MDRRRTWKLPVGAGAIREPPHGRRFHVPSITAAAAPRVYAQIGLHRERYVGIEIIAGVVFGVVLAAIVLIRYATRNRR